MVRKNANKMKVSEASKVDAAVCCAKFSYPIFFLKFFNLQKLCFSPLCYSTIRWFKGAVVIECSVCHEHNCIRCKKTHTAKCSEKSQAGGSPVAESEPKGNGKPLETDLDDLIDQYKDQKIPETEGTTRTSDPEHVSSETKDNQFSQVLSEFFGESEDKKQEVKRGIDSTLLPKSNEPGSSKVRKRRHAIYHHRYHQKESQL